MRSGPGGEQPRRAGGGGLAYLIRHDNDARFSFFVVSAAPRVVVESALAGVVAPENIFGADVHVMLLVNNGDGFTITVSENQQLARIAKRTVLSESAFSILLPVLNRLFLLTPSELRDLFSRQPLGARAYRSPNGECRQSA